MTRNLKVLGLALVAVFALSAVAATAAMAAPEFTAAVGATQTAKIKGAQIGVGGNRFDLNNQELTCATADYPGNFITVGPHSPKVTIQPVYEECHVIVPIIGTRTATVTLNGCDFEFTAGGTNPNYTATTAIVCPTGKKIEIHIYNTASTNDAGATVLCTYSIAPATGLTSVKLFNKAGPPTDIEAELNVSVPTVRETGSEALCGAVNATSKQTGNATLQATEPNGTIVNGSVSG